MGFFAGNVLKLTEDMGVLQPTFFPSVPRLFNRIYGNIQAIFKEATGMKGWLVNSAVEAKLSNLHNGYGVLHSVYDYMVFNKIKEILGGRVRVCLTGSAPISHEVLDFLKIAFCCEVLEGYGMTENCGGACVTKMGDV